MVVVISLALFFLDKVGFFNYGVNLLRNFVIMPATRSLIYIGEEGYFLFKNVFGVRQLVKENLF